MTSEDSAFAVLGALGDPVRRRLYRHVAAAPDDVGRDAAADAAGVSRSLAAFHLDKLVEAGLLAVSFRRLSGRTGPGAGRPAKLYRRAEGEHAVSVPPRSYGAVGRLLADVVENAGLDRELQAAARAAGAEACAAAPAGDLVDELKARGYQPFWDEREGEREDERQGEREGGDGDGDEGGVGGGGGRTLRLKNCPFRALADEFPALICGMNLALIEGLAPAQWSPVMDPLPGGCCVALSKNNDH